MTLRDNITAEIAAGGPLPLPRYMQLCADAYYARGTAFGAAGDFTTAPEISQLFGELVGLWLVAAWERLGSPGAFTLLELGPGRGTLLADALRVARVRPAFLAALDLRLLEASPALRAQQRDRLAGHNPQWLDSLDDLPAQPTLVVANEFFDALPVTQLRRTEDGWQQRAVAIDGGALVWAELPCAPAAVPPDLLAAPLGVWVEHCADARRHLQTLCALLQRHNGVALVVDYGEAVRPATLRQGDTLQALRGHAPTDPLADPGMADLTCHVDFAPLLAIARAAGLSARLLTQGAFLAECGIAARAAQLRQKADADQAAALDAALRRLTHADEMGMLFKVLELRSSAHEVGNERSRSGSLDDPQGGA